MPELPGFEEFVGRRRQGPGGADAQPAEGRLAARLEGWRPQKLGDPRLETGRSELVKLRRGGWKLEGGDRFDEGPAARQGAAEEVRRGKELLRQPGGGHQHQRNALPERTHLLIVMLNATLSSGLMRRLK